MPTYPFQCLSCAAEFDETLPMSAPRDKVQCPSCGGKTRQTFRGCAPTVMLKMQPGGNSGFYRADEAYRKMVQQATRESYERYRQPSKNPISQNDAFFESLCEAGFDQHKPTLYGSPGAAEMVSRGAAKEGSTHATDHQDTHSQPAESSTVASPASAA